MNRTDEIWAVVPVKSAPPPSSTGPANAPTFTQMLRAFQRGVAERIGPDDAESHYHLAHAYRAMLAGWALQCLTLAGYALVSNAWLFGAISLIGGGFGAAGSVGSAPPAYRKPVVKSVLSNCETCDARPGDPVFAKLFAIALP